MTRTARVPEEVTVPMREAKAGLSGFARLARAGARVVVTVHGTPVADIVPHGTGKTSAGDRKRPGPLPRPIRLKGTGPTASDLVLKGREG